MTQPLGSTPDLQTITIPFSPNQTSSATIRKTVIIATSIIGLLAAGAGIGYLVATKTIESNSCPKNPPTTLSEEPFWIDCCRPLLSLIKCLDKRISNFFHILRQCPSSLNSDCSP